jgi:hypothetical protein
LPQHRARSKSDRRATKNSKIKTPIHACRLAFLFVGRTVLPYGPFPGLQWDHGTPDPSMRQCDKHGVEHRTPMNQTPLMAAAAAAAGNVALIEALLARGAETSAIDHLGRNALHWAMVTAFRDGAYATTSFGAVYQLVAPACIDVMAGERLVRIDRQQSEYLLFQTMWVLFKSCFGRADASDRGSFDAGMLLEAYEKMPSDVLAPERKNRAFISGLLARNEINREYTYNRRLFKRLSTGLYQLNPELALRRRSIEGGGWIPAFSVLNLSLVKEPADPRYTQHIDTLLRLAGLPPATEAMAYEHSSAKRRTTIGAEKHMAASLRRPQKSK